MVQGLRALAEDYMGSQHQHSGSQPFAIPAPGDLTPYSGLLMKQVHTCTHPFMSTRHKNKNK